MGAGARRCDYTTVWVVCSGVERGQNSGRHRVRRVPGVRRLSAVLFVAPDLDVKMAPAERV